MILTIGGTMPAPGPSSKQIVPIATLAVVERVMVGMAEMMRTHASHMTRLAMLDRGVVGIRGRTLIANLPEGASAAVLFLEGIVDLIAPVVAHLQEQPDAPQIADDLEISDESLPARSASKAASTNEPESRRKQLNVEEFAAFLQRT